jgi:hypothetical protein
MLRSVRAAFSDPQGRKIWRVLPYAIPALLILLAIFGPIHGETAAVLGFLGYGLLHFVGMLDLRQQRPASAEIECGPGYVRIMNAGPRSQRIAAKDIIGATSARGGSGILLTLQHRRRTAPITIELADEADAEKVRHALGIGHGGFGEIGWCIEGDSGKRAAYVGNLLGAIVGACVAAFIAAEATALAILFGMVGFFATLLAIVGAISRSATPSIVMTAGGVRLRTQRGWFALPYEALRDIHESPQQFVFFVSRPYDWVVVDKSRRIVGGLSASEGQVITDQLMAAALRARGMGRQKDDVTGRVDVLRRHGESPRDWLVRLDMAGQMLASGSGYRGNSLDTEDLWAILEDPEAEPELRAAAARVLRHARKPDTRVRIDAALAAVRDDVTNRRIRIAVRDDVDAASEELSALDYEDLHARQAMRMHG